MANLYKNSAALSLKPFPATAFEQLVCAAILRAVALQGGTWGAIMAEVTTSVGSVRDWMPVRNVLQAMLNRNLVMRADTAATEAYAAPAPRCECCGKPLRKRDRLAYESEGGEGWPAMHELCAERETLADKHGKAVRT